MHTFHVDRELLAHDVAGAMPQLDEPEQRVAVALKLDGRTVYAWCAWDTLFLPELIGRQRQRGGD